LPVVVGELDSVGRIICEAIREDQILLPPESERFIKPERSGIAGADLQSKRHSFEWSRLVKKLEETSADTSVAGFWNYAHLIHKQESAAEFVTPIRDKQRVAA
jgi:hypothetical protein